MRAWSSTARIRIELASALMTSPPSLSRRASPTTTNGGETRHKQCRQESSPPPPYPPRRHSRPSAYHPQVWRARACHASRSVCPERSRRDRGYDCGALRAEDWRWSSFRDYAMGEEGVVEVESPATGRKRERMGTVPRLKTTAPTTWGV